MWVRLGLVGIRTRAQAMGWLVASAAGAVLIGALIAIVVRAHGLQLVWSVAAGLAIAAFLSLATLWYWLAVRWMDSNDGWSGR